MFKLKNLTFLSIFIIAFSGNLMADTVLEATMNLNANIQTVSLKCKNKSDFSESSKNKMKTTEIKSDKTLSQNDCNKRIEELEPKIKTHIIIQPSTPREYMFCTPLFLYEHEYSKRTGGETYKKVNTIEYDSMKKCDIAMEPLKNRGEQSKINDDITAFFSKHGTKYALFESDAQSRTVRNGMPLELVMAIISNGFQRKTEYPDRHTIVDTLEYRGTVFKFKNSILEGLSSPYKVEYKR